jgi:hypothetical protein
MYQQAVILVDKDFNRLTAAKADSLYRRIEAPADLAFPLALSFEL